ncbi:hypothetical protein ILYODFUR_032767 [Ilyodon furcidens]|uniref:Uncharacterized protein n=1 Tax=Ilyodon furcidens TaxID=33524 RepID=A0ABV0TCX8_9TELE
MWEQRKTIIWRCCFFLLQTCGAVHLDCKATSNGNRMLYGVSNRSHPLDFKGAQCDYWWNDGNIVLATNFSNNKSTLVMSHSFDTLEVSGCLSKVSWIQQCWLQMRGLIYYEANCSTTCVSKDLLHEDNTTPKDEDGQSHFRTGAIIGSLGLVVPIIYLVYKFRKRRMLSCSLCGRQYSNVKQENHLPGQSNV